MFSFPVYWLKCRHFLSPFPLGAIYAYRFTHNRTYTYIRVYTLFWLLHGEKSAAPTTKDPSFIRLHRIDDALPSFCTLYLYVFLFFSFLFLCEYFVDITGSVITLVLSEILFLFSIPSMYNRTFGPRLKIQIIYFQLNFQ